MLFFFRNVFETSHYCMVEFNHIMGGGCYLKRSWNFFTGTDINFVIPNALFNELSFATNALLSWTLLNWFYPFIFSGSYSLTVSLVNANISPKKKRPQFTQSHHSTLHKRWLINCILVLLADALCSPNQLPHGTQSNSNSQRFVFNCSAKIPLIRSSYGSPA